MAEGTVTLNSLHPWAWWCWAIGLGLAASGTTNPLLLTLIALAAITVVMLRRTTAPWARSVGVYLALAAFILLSRLFFQILIGSGGGPTVLFTLPQLPLPEWAAGIRLGGAVSAEALLACVYDALRLAVMLLCLGAANALANPRQALRSVPAALYEASVAVVIALSVAPQLIESFQRVRKARRLRGDTSRGLNALTALVLPVLGDAIDRSLSLAAGMDARGFARTNGLPVKGTLPLMLGSVMVATMGVFLLLSTSATVVALAILAVGILGTAVGLRRAGRRLRVTRYRPDRWGWRESAVAGCGVMAAAIVTAVGALNPWAMMTPTYPLTWPELSVAMLATIGFALLPLAFTRSRRPIGLEDPRQDVPQRTVRPRDVELVRP
ncbi:MAG: energy-coupling factor transporter transmembrane component T [Propionicimonas sp.]